MFGALSRPAASSSLSMLQCQLLRTTGELTTTNRCRRSSNDITQLLFQSEKRLRANVKVERKTAAVCECMRNKHFVTLRPTDERQHKAKYKKPVINTQGYGGLICRYIDTATKNILYRNDEKCRECMKQ